MIDERSSGGREFISLEGSERKRAGERLDKEIVSMNGVLGSQ